MRQRVNTELGEGCLRFAEFDVAEEEFGKRGWGILVVDTEGFGKKEEFGFE